MRRPLLIHFVLLAAISRTPLVLPAAVPNVTDIELSALPRLPDSDFEYIAAYRRPSLNAQACIMASVAAMYDLALLGIDIPIRVTQTWTHPDYPGVILSFDYETTFELTARWAMFLVYSGIRDMLERGLYETSIFFGSYRGRQVGKVMFVISPGHVSTQQTQADPDTDAEANSTVHTIGFNLTHPESRPEVNDQLYAQVEYVGKAMTMMDCLLMTIYLMMALGSHHDEVLNTWQCSLRAIAVDVRTVWNSIDVPGTPPDYGFRSGDMVSMFARLASVLLRERHYSEMNVIVLDAGTVIARGLIRTKPISGSITTLSNSSVSTA
ncbi:MAG: hypothetical protein Q9220_005643 [cf. Caloplaca sp. 1 TL-2023]